MAKFQIGKSFTFYSSSGAQAYSIILIWKREKRQEIKHIARGVEFKIWHNLKCVFTFDNKFSRTLHSTQRVLCNDCVIPAVLGPNFQYHHGADPTCISDVVVSVGVEADVISVPGNMGSGVSCHCTTHVALITLWTVVCFQWNRKCGRRLKAAVLGGRKVQRKCFWKDARKKRDQSKGCYT